MKAIYNEVGPRILLVRKMRGYSREEMAKRASISPKFLYEIEYGRKGFSVAVLFKICKALDVDCDYILTGREKIDYDRKLVSALQLFDRNQIERISTILTQIHKMM